jgi:hypothetical protein
MLVAYLSIFFWDFYLTWLNLTLTEQLFWFYDYMLPMIGWLWLYMSRTSLLGVGRSIMIYFQLVTHSHLHTSMFVKWNSDRAATFQHGTQTCPFPLGGIDVGVDLQISEANASCMKQIWLVVATLWKKYYSNGIIVPKIWTNNQNVPNHQPEI